MKKAVIIVHSKTGITRMYAEEMEEYLRNKAVEVTLLSIREYKSGVCADADLVMLGCWTSGLMIFFQHPEKVWNEFAARFENAGEAKTILFTTYKILTGSMFNKMIRQLGTKVSRPFALLRSRNGCLSEKDKDTLDEFIK